MDFLKKYKNATNVLDEKHKSMLSEFNGQSEALVAFKNKYDNKKLETLVHDKYATQKIYYHQNRIYQGDEPIYRNPVFRNGTAHFYASVKMIGNVQVNTVIFNILFIWLLTIFLMVALYFDLLRKLLDYVERWRLIQLAILRDKIFYNPMAFIKGKNK